MAPRRPEPEGLNGIEPYVEAPRVNPVGVTEVPEGYVRKPRNYDPSMRLLALLMLSVFGVSVVGTTVYTLAAWCLTTIANPAPFLGVG